MSNSTIKRVSLIACICALAFSFTSLAAYSDMADQSEENTLSSASITTETQLDAYIDQVSSLNDSIEVQNIPDVMTTISFSDYLSFTDVADYIKMYDADAQQLQLRAVDANGNKLTMITRTDLGLDETEALLTKEALVDDYTIIGVCGMNALLDSTVLRSVEADTRTYLADTSGDPIFMQSQNTVAAQAEDHEFPQPLTWNLEELNILTY